MTILILLVALVLLYIIASKVDYKYSVILDSTLLIIVISIFKFQIPSFSIISERFNDSIVILLCVSIIHGMLFYDKNRPWMKYSKCIRMLIPTVPLILNALNLELALIFSMVTYNLLIDSTHEKRVVLISYLIAGIAIIKYLLESYYNSPLAIVNYQILDIYKYMILGMSILAFVSSVAMARSWANDKESKMLNIFWPLVFITLSSEILKSGMIYQEYLVILSVLLISTTVLYSNERYAMGLIAGIVSLLFVNPYLYLLPLLLIILIHFKNKLKYVGEVLKIEMMDISTLIILIAAYKLEVGMVGVLSIFIFLYMIRNLNKEIVGE